jgi:spermidine/putrescine transport system ATP-binding protein
LTFLHVTHDQEEARDMADTVAVMNKGEIEQMGAPEALYERPRTAFVAKFLGQSNIFVGNVKDSSTNSLSIEVAGSKISVPRTAPRSNPARSPSVFALRRQSSTAPHLRRVQV